MKKNAWKNYSDADVLSKVTVRLISPEEKDHWDQLIIDRHYLENADLVGRQLRYVAELDGEWVALLGWNTACYHLRDRDEEVGWDVEQRLKRLKFIAQNSRYLLLVERGRYPNLASRILSLCTARLSEDWQAHFGHPLLAVESFVDPERFGGACYRASGWMHLGKTKGFRRHRRDFYQQDSHPKDLWFRWLKGKARRWLSAETMPPRWAQYEEPVAYCPFSADELRSLWADLQQLADPRGRKGRLYSLGGVLTLCAAATLCGCRGTRAIADFGRHLNQKQLRMLRCYRNKRTGRYQAPSEPTIRWILTQIPASEFNRVVTEWMSRRDERCRRLAVDGKTVKGARQADGRALHLVAAVTHETGRLVAQRPVDEKSNEITALRPLLEDVDLNGVTVTADAMQAQQEAARLIVQEKGGDYLFTLKGNQPGVQAKAEQLLNGAFPPWTKGAIPDH